MWDLVNLWSGLLHVNDTQDAPSPHLPQTEDGALLHLYLCDTK